MAENVKRRVAAARMAVAFVAAGTIAGAAAWAQASPPAPTAKSSALNAYLKHKPLTSANIADGSLLYKDFKKHQVPSYRMFQKAELSRKHFEKVELNRVYPKVEIDRDFIKIKDADARYVKIDDIGTKVVGGKGSVFTATRVLPTVNKVTLLDVPGRFTVDTQGPTITITNTSSSPLTYSSCGAGGAGTLQPNEHTDCDDTDAVHTLQLIGGADGTEVATLDFSYIPTQGTPNAQVTVQVLIGL
jgi:hypothetical protein